jgi:uncharacterized protein (TIGR02453 family)
MAFRGWPAEALEFYAGLEADNSRTYWQAHREVYETCVKAPFLALSELVEREFGPLRMFRPHRDTRFSKDKSPYKTAAAAVTEGPGGCSYYLQISAEGLYVGSGYYMFAPDQLERFRAAVADDRTGKHFARAIEALRTQRYDVAARDSLKRVPRGFPPDHPRAELLKQKGAHIGRQFTPAKWLHTKAAADRITEVWRAAAPAARWLDKHVGPSTLAPPEPD